jgi:hypothetical protein
MSFLGSIITWLRSKFLEPKQREAEGTSTSTKEMKIGRKELIQILIQANTPKELWYRIMRLSEGVQYLGNKKIECSRGSGIELLLELLQEATSPKKLWDEVGMIGLIERVSKIKNRGEWEGIVDEAWCIAADGGSFRDGDRELTAQDCLQLPLPSKDSELGGLWWELIDRRRMWM